MSALAARMAGSCRRLSAVKRSTSFFAAYGHNMLGVGIIVSSNLLRLHASQRTSSKSGGASSGSQQRGFSANTCTKEAWPGESVVVQRGE